jgi:ATP-dependent Clp protease adaptor protein ClpS
MARLLETFSRFWKGAEERVFDPQTRLLDTGAFPPLDSAFGIEVLNDKLTPMDFVVEQLVAHAGLSNKDAVQAMLRIHVDGGMFLPLPTEEEALRAADEISRSAKQKGHPLICRSVDFRQANARLGE